MDAFVETICQLRDLGLSKAANIIRDLERDNMTLAGNNFKLREQLAATQAEVEALRQKLSEAESDQLSWLTYRHVVDRVEDLEREAVCLRGQLEESRANDRTAMGYLSQVMTIVGGDDFPDMVRRVEALRKDKERLDYYRDDLRSAIDAAMQPAADSAGKDAT